MSKNQTTFSVTLEDFYYDDDSNGIEGALSKHIKDQVVYQIWEKIKVKVEDQIQRDVKDRIEKEFTRQIAQQITQVVTSTDSILKGVQGYDEKGNWVKKDCTIKVYVQDKFKKDSGWGSPNEVIEKLAKNFAVELKNRYDILFASQIVNKMHEQGLLKDDAIQTLLSK